MQKETEWMAKNQEFQRILEFMMTEALRRGLSQHMAEVTPCVAYDLQKILTLCHLALGKYFSLMQKINDSYDSV